MPFLPGKGEDLLQTVTSARCENRTRLAPPMGPFSTAVGRDGPAPSSARRGLVPSEESPISNEKPSLPPLSMGEEVLAQRASRSGFDANSRSSRSANSM